MDTALSPAVMANDFDNIIEAHIAATSKSKLPNLIFNTDRIVMIGFAHMRSRVPHDVTALNFARHV
jgi:hypothetical protein